MFYWRYMLERVLICYGNNFIVGCIVEVWFIMYFIKMNRF